MSHAESQESHISNVCAIEYLIRGAFCTNLWTVGLSILLSLNQIMLRAQAFKSHRSPVITCHPLKNIQQTPWAMSSFLFIINKSKKKKNRGPAFQQGCSYLHGRRPQSVTGESLPAVSLHFFSSQLFIKNTTKRKKKSTTLKRHLRLFLWSDHKARARKPRWAELFGKGGLRDILGERLDCKFNHLTPANH